MAENKVTRVMVHRRPTCVNTHPLFNTKQFQSRLVDDYQQVFTVGLLVSELYLGTYVFAR